MIILYYIYYAKIFFFARFLNYWPWGVIVDNHYLTNHNRDNIKNALRDMACAAGLEHHDWFNPGSSWYGDARRIRNMAKLTVALYKFGRAQMFGPGTSCRSEQFLYA